MNTRLAIEQYKTCSNNEITKSGEILNDKFAGVLMHIHSSYLRTNDIFHLFWVFKVESKVIEGYLSHQLCKF